MNLSTTHITIHLQLSPAKFFGGKSNRTIIKKN